MYLFHARVAPVVFSTEYLLIQFDPLSAVLGCCSLPLEKLPHHSALPTMMVPKANRLATYKYLFEGELGGNYAHTYVCSSSLLPNPVDQAQCNAGGCAA